MEFSPPALPNGHSCQWGEKGGEPAQTGSLEGYLSSPPCCRAERSLSVHPSPQFSFLMTEALLVFSPESSLLRSLSRKGRARCHWVLQLLALLCALLGLGLVVLHKEQLGKTHLATWHGRLGLLAVLWAVLQCSGGVGLLYPKLLPRWPLAKLKLYHATSGLVGYLLGSASLLLGMCSLWFTATVTGGVWYLAVLCPVITSLVIMNQVSNAYLYRKRIQP